MPSKKKPPVADAKSVVVAVAEHPANTSQVPPEPSPQVSAPAHAPNREAQIRQAAYAAHERRGGLEGDAVQDWLEAEAQWERDRSR